MKFALAVVLLIGISCQIGQGDCAPDLVYESFRSMMSGAYSLTQNTYHSVIDHLTPLTDYLPSVPVSLTDRLSDIKESTENLGSDTGNMLNNGLNSAENLGSYTGDMLKSGVGHIGNAVD